MGIVPGAAHIRLHVDVVVLLLAHEADVLHAATLGRGVSVSLYWHLGVEIWVRSFRRLHSPLHIARPHHLSCDVLRWRHRTLTSSLAQ